MKSLQKITVQLFLFILLIKITAFNCLSQIVINEVMSRPSGAQGLIEYNGAMGKEYIELYNTSCSTVDVSGYFIAAISNRRMCLGTQEVY